VEKQQVYKRKRMSKSDEILKQIFN